MLKICYTSKDYDEIRTLKSCRKEKTDMAKRKKKSSKTPVLIAVLVLMILILAGLCVFYFGLKHYLGRMNYVDDSDITINYDLLTADNDDIEGFTEMETLDAQAASVFANEVNAGQNIDVASDGDVYNILLIGSDTRNSWYGNSDSMILASINSKTKTIYMTSFMRDLYANIPNVGIRKLNSAYAIGAGPLLVSTIESNYRIDIDNYASVDFNSMAQIIDLVGGVDLEVSTQEAGYLNKYLDEICALQGLNPADYYVAGGGMTHLNGNQAVAFARIRYTSRGSEHSDYGRTSRQREILTQLMQKARTLDAATLLNVVNNMLPLITHNIDTATLTSLIANVASYVNYDIQTDRIPYDGMYSSLGEELVPDFEATINRLHQTIYGN